MYLALAWRNIWRNKRRSIISISSILFAVIIALGMRSMQLGTYDHMIKNVVSFYTGYIQVHDQGYWEKKSINKSFRHDKTLIEKVESVQFVGKNTPRLDSFGLISNGDITDGALIAGVDPEGESEVISLKEKVIDGRYLKKNDQGILLASGLAKHLQAGVGDTIVILSQGYHGVTAAGKYEVAGLVEFPAPDINNRTSFLTLPTAQELFGAYDRITSLIVMIDKQEHLQPVMADLKTQLNTEEYEVMSWEEMMPELVQSIEADNASGLIMLLIIYMVIGFGILGTILMMTLERSREFGMMIAIGMKRMQLRLIVIIESVLLTFTGVVSGTILGIPILVYMYFHPIPLKGDLAKAMEIYGWDPVLPFSLDPSIFLWQAITVFIIALIAVIFPLWRIGYIEPVEELRTA